MKHARNGLNAFSDYFPFTIYNYACYKKDVKIISFENVNSIKIHAIYTSFNI